MPRIKVLDENTACLIAAGEVVERPVSVVKELVENSLDAGADSIIITLEGGGTDLITVVDNGCGISQEDTPLAFQRHATSKISGANDLGRIETLGFRGEALPGIAAVSEMLIKTRVSDSNEGYFMHIRGGGILDAGPAGCPAGTSVDVRELFFNTPARRKHLKSKSTEGGLIADLVYKLALIRPGVRFALRQKGREVFRVPGTGKLLDALAAVYGVEAAGMMIPLSAAEGDIAVSGFVSKPELSRSTRQHITIAVNGRLVRSTALNMALDEAYRGLMAVGRHPLAVLHLQLPLDSIDVNVHPAKTEIKMENEDQVVRLITAAVRKALREANLIPAGGAHLHGKNDYPSTGEPYKLSFSASDPGDYAGAGSTLHIEPVGEGSSSVKNRAVEQDGSSDPAGQHRPHSPAPRREEGITARHLEVRETGLTTGYGSGAAGSHQGADPGVYPAADQCEETVNGENNTGAPVQHGNRDRSGFPRLEVVGQILNLYIICQGEEGAYLIDQHAAHERVLFEKYYEQMLSNNPAVQYLLAPLNVNLRAHEKELLREYREQLAALGFVLEDFGRDSLLLRGIPAECSPGESERLIVDLVETILAKGKTGDCGVKFALSALLSCKAAVKAGERLTPRAMQSLVGQLARCAEPYTCPHGRPTLVSINRRELNAMFKRT